MEKKNAGKTLFNWSLLLPLLPLAFSALLILTDSGPQRVLQRYLFDQFQLWSPRIVTDLPVRIIDIDEESLQHFGQWPWPRTRMAELLDYLNDSGAAAVGFDVIFAEADRTSPRNAIANWPLGANFSEALQYLPDHDEVFAQSLARSNAVLAFALERNRVDALAPVTMPQQKARFVHLGEKQSNWLHPFLRAVPSLPLLETAASGNGALSFVPSGDGVVRRISLAMRVNDVPVPTLAAELLRVVQGEKNIMLKSAGQNNGLQEVRIGQLAVRTTAQSEVWLHYSKEIEQRYIPAWKVLSGKLARAEIRDRIILIGSSAQGLMDLRFSPRGLIPGVEVHAQALEQILAGDVLQRPPWAEGAEGAIMVVCALLIGLIGLYANALLAAALTLATVFVLLAGSWYAFAEKHLLLDAASPVSVTLFAFMVCGLAHHLSSEREQRWIKSAFARYVSPNRVDFLVNHPEEMALGGHRRECSFVFTDLEDFTRLMEQIDPAQAVSLLNRYLDEMIAVAFKYEGTLDRIVGDAVAIVFSAPVRQDDHRRRALACALEMHAFASRFSQELKHQAVPFGATRIGVHGGEVIVGNFGGSNIFDYRALGDPVNTAARLESVNKILGTHICVSAYILADCPEASARPVGRLLLKGKSIAIEVFEPSVVDERQRAPVEAYTQAYEALRQKDAAAIEKFTALAAAYPEDPLVLLHLQRLQAGEEGDLIEMLSK